MVTIKNENIRPFDVDDTLVINYNPNDPTQVPIEVLDPVEGTHIRMAVQEPMVRLLKEEQQRGSFIIVWSRGGYDWARAVVTALGLVDKVDLIMSKPLVYFDDKDVSEWLTDRVYIPPTTRYKK